MNSAKSNENSFGAGWHSGGSRRKFCPMIRNFRFRVRLSEYEGSPYHVYCCTRTGILCRRFDFDFISVQITPVLVLYIQRQTQMKRVTKGKVVSNTKYLFLYSAACRLCMLVVPYSPRPLCPSCANNVARNLGATSARDFCGQKS